MYQKYSKLTIILIIIFLASACASASMFRRPEPPVIIVRNSSRQDYKAIILKDPRRESGKASKLGMVSPVLNGTSQVFERPTSPLPLPSMFEITLVENSGNKVIQSIFLGNVLKQSTGQPNERLVFEVGMGGRIEPIVEYYPTKGKMNYKKGD